jgi:hypothetical protein
MYVARRYKSAVFFECSPKRCRQGWNPGADADVAVINAIDDRQRFDLVIWRKSVDKLRAIIEIKRAYRTADLQQDAIKVQKFIKHASEYGLRTGYLLAYTEAVRNGGNSGRNTIDRRFDHWRKKLSTQVPKIRLIDGFAVEPKEVDNGKTWAWGSALYRIDRPQMSANEPRN